MGDLSKSHELYVSYLVDLLADPIHLTARGWLEDIREDVKRRPQYLKHFQGALADVPGWSAARVEDEMARLLPEEDRQYTAKLIRSIFLLEVKLAVLGSGDGAAAPGSDAHKVPSLETFVHRCFIEASRQYWKRMFLFDTACTSLEKQRNYTACEAIAVKAVKDTLRKLAPVRDVLLQPSTVAAPPPPPSEPSEDSDDESDYDDEEPAGEEGGKGSEALEGSEELEELEAPEEPEEPEIKASGGTVPTRKLFFDASPHA